MALEGTWSQFNLVVSPQCYTSPPCLVLYHPTQGYVFHHGQLYLKDVSTVFKPFHPNISYAGVSNVLSNGSGVPRGWEFGDSNSPRNSEDIGGVLARMSKKNRQLDFLL